MILPEEDAAKYSRLLTPHTTVFEELNTRRQNKELVKSVESYIGEDMPDYFRDSPFLYLARHVATPNFETVRFLHLVEPLNIRVLIGQDPEDKFVPSNPLKHALGKVSICTSISASKNACIENFKKVSIIDFTTSSGKQLKDVKTLWGESLIDFHNDLFKAISPRADFTICDESAWLNDRFKGNPLEYYKHLLPFFIVHGVLFEDYLFNDRVERDFLESVVYPAFESVEQMFGVTPLITRLVPETFESQPFWIAYPHTVSEIIKKRMEGLILPSPLPAAVSG